MGVEGLRRQANARCAETPFNPHLGPPPFWGRRKEGICEQETALVLQFGY